MKMSISDNNASSQTFYTIHQCVLCQRLSAEGSVRENVCSNSQKRKKACFFNLKNA